MSATPLTEAIETLRHAVAAALKPLVAPHGVFWLQATQGAPRPFVIFQEQTNGGAAIKYLGDYGWRGIVTIRTLADSQSAAEALLAAVVPGMNSLAVAGYSFFTEYIRPVVIPPDLDGIFQSGHSYDVEIHKP